MERILEELEPYVGVEGKFIITNEKILFSKEELANIKRELNINAKQFSHKQKLKIIDYALQKEGIKVNIIKGNLYNYELDGKIGFWYGTLSWEKIIEEQLNAIDISGIIEAV